MLFAAVTVFIVAAVLRAIRDTLPVPFRRMRHRPRALELAQEIEVPPCQTCGSRPICRHDRGAEKITAFTATHGYRDDPSWGFPEPQWSREMRRPVEEGTNSPTPRRPFVKRPPPTSRPGPGIKVSQ